MVNFLFRRHRWAVICLAFIFLLSVVPLIPMILEGAAFDGIVSSRYVDTYYVPMAREVFDGHPLMGNPFYLEHSNKIAPAFILPFWLYALPLMAGLPVAATAELNFTLWSMVFGAVLYIFFRRLGLPGPWSAIGTILSYMHVYGELRLPISMELVHPVFLLFILAFFLWWECPADKYRDAFLGFASAFAFYDYTYMLQIIAAFLGLVFIYVLYIRDWSRVRHGLVVGLYAGVLSIPFLILTLMQLNDPYYFESMQRIGLGYTHIPAGEALRGAARFFSLAGLAYVSWKWIFRVRELPHASFMVQFFLLGIAIQIMSVGNVITGLDLETASHASRFILMWLVIGSMAAAYYLFSVRSSLARLPVKKKAVIGLFLAAVAVSNLTHSQFDIGMFDISARRELVGADQAALPALRWLDENEEQPKVVWTNPDNRTLFALISVHTKHYLLFSVTGVLQLLPTNENEERYLVAHALSNPTLESITSDVWDYDGVGAAIDTPNTINRSVKLCRALRLPTFGHHCGSMVNARTLYAQHYVDMHEKFKNEIQPHLREELEKFHVAYILKDIEKDTEFHPERLSFVKQVYSDGRFVIYKLQ